MSYLRKYEYTIIPEGSYQIIRNCSVCGCKSTFISCDKFRVNANKNRIDIWLIYKCKKCKHTYNLTIYERIKIDNLSPNLIRSFTDNNKELANKYGTDKSLFIRNKAEIDWSNVKYYIKNNESQKRVNEAQITYKSGDCIHVSDPFGLNIRIDKVLAKILNITRSQVKQLQKSEDIEIRKNSPAKNIEIIIYKDIDN